MRLPRTAAIGISSTAPLLLAGALPAAAAGDPLGADIFDPAPVLQLRIELSEEAVARLEQDFRGYVRGTVLEGERACRDVGVRLKGSIGSLRRLRGKPGFGLKFNHFVPEQRFHAAIGDGGGSRATWRQTVLLPPGRYRFTGRLRTLAVEPTERLGLDGGRSSAALRLSGEQPRSKLLGTHDWTTSAFEFEIEPEEEWEGEQPASRVELVFELEASRGEAWFDEEPLELRRLSEPKEAGAAGAGPPGLLGSAQAGALPKGAPC